MVIANTIWEIPAIDIKTNLVFNGADWCLIYRDIFFKKEYILKLLTV
jgi:hypothetical protein